MTLTDQIDLYPGDSDGVNLTRVGTRSQYIAQAVLDDNISIPLVAISF